jgi:hypothetical protein
MNFLPYLLAALALWVHPTNSVQMNDSQRITVECGTYPGLTTAYTLTSLLVRKEAVIYVVCASWEKWPEDQRLWVMAHEVGHLFGLWDADGGLAHGGDGIMACTVPSDRPCLVTAAERLQIAKMMPSPIVRRAIVPMVAH